MRFRLPNHPTNFEIPDEWWEAATMPGFVPLALAYAHLPIPEGAIGLIDLGEIAPPVRAQGVQQFDRNGIVVVLMAMRMGTPLPPLPLHCASGTTGVRYSLRDGMHRFFASAAVGFPKLPA